MRDELQDDVVVDHLLDGLVLPLGGGPDGVQVVIEQAVLLRHEHQQLDGAADDLQVRVGEHGLDDLVLVDPLRTNGGMGLGLSTRGQRGGGVGMQQEIVWHCDWVDPDEMWFNMIERHSTLSIGILKAISGLHFCTILWILHNVHPSTPSIPRIGRSKARFNNL